MEASRAAFRDRIHLAVTLLPNGEVGNGSGLIDALSELGEAARAHFQRTTALMSEIGFEGLQKHYSESALLMAEYAELLRGWSQKGLRVLEERTERVVREWLLAHILGVDRAFVDAYGRSTDRVEPMPLRAVEATWQV